MDNSLLQVRGSPWKLAEWTKCSINEQEVRRTTTLEREGLKDLTEETWVKHWSVSIFTNLRGKAKKPKDAAFNTLELINIQKTQSYIFGSDFFFYTFTLISFYIFSPKEKKAVSTMPSFLHSDSKIKVCALYIKCSSLSFPSTCSAPSFFPHQSHFHQLTVVCCHPKQCFANFLLWAAYGWVNRVGQDCFFKRGN